MAMSTHPPTHEIAASGPESPLRKGCVRYKSSAQPVRATSPANNGCRDTTNTANMPIQDKRVTHRLH